LSPMLLSPHSTRKITDSLDVYLTPADMKLILVERDNSQPMS